MLLRDELNNAYCMLQYRIAVPFHLLIYCASHFESAMKFSECVSVFFGLFMTTEAFERMFSITESTTDEQRLTFVMHLSTSTYM